MNRNVVMFVGAKIDFNSKLLWSQRKITMENCPLFKNLFPRIICGSDSIKESFLITL